jgi:hypothetical protein
MDLIALTGVDDGLCWTGKQSLSLTRLRTLLGLEHTQIALRHA